MDVTCAAPNLRQLDARGKVWVPPAPGMMPNVTSVKAKRAPSDA